MIGAQKISELNLLTKDNTELIPVIQDDGAGGWINGKLPISDMGTDTNFANTNLTLTGNRTHDLDSNLLQFDNGQVVFGTAIGTAATVEINNTAGNFGLAVLSTGSKAITAADGTGIGVEGGTDSGQGVYGLSSGVGSAFLGESVSGLAALLRGGAYVETYSFGGSAEASAVFEASATTKGALMPRMTTTQRDAISSPATSLVIFNTTTGRFEHYNGTYWAGEKRILYVHHPSYNPSDSQTNFFSNIAIVPVTTTTAHEVILRGNGVIRACDFNTWAATAVGTNEAFSLYIRINSTDYLVQTISAATQKRSFVNTSLNIPFVDGDVLRMNYVTPAWATNPTGLIGAGNLIIE